MSANPIDFPYGDRAAQLLADIADALLNGKENWSTLERLQKALTNTGLDDLREISGIFTKANAEAISKSGEDVLAKVYEKKMRDMLHADPSFTKIEGSPVYNYAFTEKPSSTTTNSAEWIKYSMRDYGAKYDPGTA